VRESNLTLTLQTKVVRLLGESILKEVIENTNTIQYDLHFYSANLHVDMIKCASHRVLRLPNGNYILSPDYFIFTTIVILLS
jgi:hypothetical protein